jgi:hypothetical protein
VPAAFAVTVYVPTSPGVAVIVKPAPPPGPSVATQSMTIVLDRIRASAAPQPGLTASTVKARGSFTVTWMEWIDSVERFARATENDTG